MIGPGVGVATGCVCAVGSVIAVGALALKYQAPATTATNNTAPMTYVIIDEDSFISSFSI